MNYKEVIEAFERDGADLAKKGHWCIAERYQFAVNAMKELQAYKNLNMTLKQIQEMQTAYCATELFLNEYRKLGTLEEIKKIIEERS